MAKFDSPYGKVCYVDVDVGYILAAIESDSLVDLE